MSFHTSTRCTELCLKCRAGLVRFEIHVVAVDSQVDAPIYFACHECGAMHVITVTGRTDTGVSARVELAAP